MCFWQQAWQRPGCAALFSSTAETSSPPSPRPGPEMPPCGPEPEGASRAGSDNWGPPHTHVRPSQRAPPDACTPRTPPQLRPARWPAGPWRAARPKNLLQPGSRGVRVRRCARHPFLGAWAAAQVARGGRSPAPGGRGPGLPLRPRPAGSQRPRACGTARRLGRPLSALPGSRGGGSDLSLPRRRRRRRHRGPDAPGRPEWATCSSG